MTSVSIVIPLYNYARWIGEAVQSAKDARPLEIIVVDDCSTDKPVMPPGVIYIRNVINIGVAESRNKGIAQAKGDLILCLDADDKLAPDYIERALPHFEDPRIGIVYGPLSLIREDGSKVGQRWFDGPFNYANQSNGHNSVPTCCIFRKEAWARAGGSRAYEKPAEDAALWLRITSQGWRVGFINDDKATAYYRMHEGSQTSLHPRFDWWKIGRAWRNRNSGVGHPVQIYDCPNVSFVITYHAEQELEFIRTLDSIEGLAAIDWEIHASGVPTSRLLDGWPFVRWNAERCAPTVVYLKAGEIVTDAEWDIIMERKEWPR